MPEPVTTHPARPRATWRVLLLGGVLGVLLAATVEAGRVVVGDNLHTVLPGRVYRCSQQSGPELEALIRAHGIRTVINLRGGNVESPWYVDEARATHGLGVCLEDVCFSASRLPSMTEVRRLVEVFDRTEYPVLLHCRRGADRTGLASALVLLLAGETPPAQAYRQLGPRYGHVAFGRTAFLDRFLELYREWLASQGREHSASTFRQWVTREYSPDGFRCRIEPLDMPDRAWPMGYAMPVRVRFHNTGTRAWQFRKASNVGMHAGFVVMDVLGRQLANGRAGLFDAEVAPGESIDMTLILPPWMASGHRLRVLVDLVEEQQFWFFQTGSEPWEWEFEARGKAGATSGERDAARLAGLADRLAAGR